MFVYYHNFKIKWYDYESQWINLTFEGSGSNFYRILNNFGKLKI